MATINVYALVAGGQAGESLEFRESAVVDELVRFAASARKLPRPKVPSGVTGKQAMRRRVYYFRQATGL